MSSMAYASALDSSPPSGEATFGRMASEGLDTSHGAILYLDDISVSFDGFKALNKLSLQHRRRASCAASSGPTAPARPP